MNRLIRLTETLVDEKLIGMLCLTGIAGMVIFFIPDKAETIVLPIITGVSGFITGKVYSNIKTQ